MPVGSTIKISGYCKASGTSSLANEISMTLLVFAKVTSADGRNLWGQQAVFTGGTNADWEHKDKTFVVGKVVKSVSLYALYRYDPLDGTAYFDDLALEVQAAA